MIITRGFPVRLILRGYFGGVGMATNREVGRDQIAAWLLAYLGVLVKTISVHKLPDPKGQFALVYVRSAGSERGPDTFTSNYPIFFYNIRVIVQRSTQTDAEAVDQIDAIEAQVAEMCEKETTPTLFVGYDGGSEVYDVKDDKLGEEFYVEDIRIRYHLYGS